MRLNKMALYLLMKLIKLHAALLIHVRGADVSREGVQRDLLPLLKAVRFLLNMAW